MSLSDRYILPKDRVARLSYDPYILKTKYPVEMLQPLGSLIGLWSVYPLGMQTWNRKREGIGYIPGNGSRLFKSCYDINDGPLETNLKY